VPKIRGVKPDLWTDEDFVELSPYARLLWIGLWNYACDNGHIQDKSKQIKMRVLPTDDVNCAELLREIEGQGLIERADGWVTIPNLSHHQKPHKRWFVTCDKAGCEMPDGYTYGFSKPGSTVEQPLSNGGSTADVEVDGDGELKVMVTKAPRKRPATTFPAYWTPTEAHLDRASDGIDIQREADSFRAHAEANDRRCVNWNAAFTQWLIKARPTQTQHPHRGRAAQWMDLTREMAAEQQQAPRQIGGTS
jgi:hypothetical protein